jgi:hypothetical protein
MVVYMNLLKKLKKKKKRKKKKEGETLFIPLIAPIL